MSLAFGRGNQLPSPLSVPPRNRMLVRCLISWNMGSIIYLTLQLAVSEIIRLSLESPTYQALDVLLDLTTFGTFFFILLNIITVRYRLSLENKDHRTILKRLSMVFVASWLTIDVLFRALNAKLLGTLSTYLFLLLTLSALSIEAIATMQVIWLVLTNNTALAQRNRIWAFVTGIVACDLLSICIHMIPGLSQVM